MPRNQGMRKQGATPGAKGQNQRRPKVSKKLTALEMKHVKHSIPKSLRRIKNDGKEIITYVLDTNVLMSAWDSIFKFEEHNVCIVGQVWKELDDHKKGHSPEAWNVRQAVREIDKLLVGKNPEEIKNGIELLPPRELVNGRAHTGKLFFDFSKPQLTEDMNVSLDVTHPDDRIILICLALKKQKKRVVLVSNDASCRVKASVVGVDAEEYLSDAVAIAQGEEDLHPGFRVMPDDFLEVAMVDCSSQKEVSTYTLKHDSLKDVVCNEFLIVEGKPLRVVSKEGKNSVIAVTSSHFDEIKQMGIKPKNIEQECALQLLLDPTLPAVSLAGKAGSGKTFLTLAAGIHLAHKMELYDRIIFTRSIQGSDEDIGFLPGDEKEKLTPWMGALYDNIESILEMQKSVSGKKVNPSFIQKLLQIKALNFMKGRSITNTLFIVDETQDLTVKTLKMIATRIGHGSKIVFLGNFAQIDNPYLTEHTCGLSVLIRTLRESNLIGHVTLQSGERSAFATLAEEQL